MQLHVLKKRLRKIKIPLWIIIKKNSQKLIQIPFKSEIKINFNKGTKEKEQGFKLKKASQVSMNRISYLYNINNNFLNKKNYKFNFKISMIWPN